jgi:hypothetical protein
MTGEKNKGTTLEKLWKLDDDTLSTPAHDDLVIKLLNVDYICEKFPEIGDAYKEFTYGNKHRICFWGNESKLKEMGRDYAARYIQENSRKVLEDHLKSRGEYPTDYSERYRKINDLQDSQAGVDILKETEDKMCSQYIERSISDTKQTEEDIKNFKESYSIKTYLNLASEVPIFSSPRFIVGYWDIVINPIPRHDMETGTHIIFKELPTYYIEVKPQIRSFGQTLRQLTTYQTYTTNPHRKIVLFTPDLRFKDAFESQGIRVVSP